MKKTKKNKNRTSFDLEDTSWEVTRREFLRSSGLFIVGISFGIPFTRAEGIDNKAKLFFGIVTDTHYADIDLRCERHYRESVSKLTECVALMNEKKVDFMIELGDFKDQGKPAVEEETLEYLGTIEKVYGQFNGPRYHVLGNHDVDSISKEQFLSRVENTDIREGSTYYSLSKEFTITP